MENSTEIWQTSVNGEIYETSFDGLVEWIAEGSLLPQDKVRKGNLRWIEANKVPALHRFFNAKEFTSANQVVTSTTAQTSASPAQTFVQNHPPPLTQNFQAPPPPVFYQELASETEKKFCLVHTETEAQFDCQTCGNYFCKSCPQNGMCPMCGALCKALKVPVMRPLDLPPPVSIAPNQEIFIDEDVTKGSYWFYWKAGLTVVNSILSLAGIYWQFFLGLTLPQLFHGILIGVAQAAPETNLRTFEGIVFLMSLIGSGITLFFGYKAGQAKKWAFILGIIIFAFDGLLYLLTMSIFGILIHIYAIYLLYKGFSACNNK